MRRPIQIAIYISRTINSKREYLLLHRTPESGGFWQGVTGGVEDEETILETATRELYEETGFDGVTIRQVEYEGSFPVPESMKHHYGAEVELLTEYVFIAEVDSDSEPVIDPAEHTEYKWVSYEVALGMLHFLSNIQALRLCQEKLSA